MAVLLLVAPFSFNVGMRAPVSIAPSSLRMVAAPAPELVESALKTVSLSNAAGDSVTVYTFGACITSYVKGGTDVLAVRPDAKLDGSKPISGGRVPAMLVSKSNKLTSSPSEPISGGMVPVMESWTSSLCRAARQR